MASLGWFRLRRGYFLFYLYLIDLIALKFTEYEWLGLSVLLQILESTAGNDDIVVECEGELHDLLVRVFINCLVDSLFAFLYLFHHLQEEIIPFHSFSGIAVIDHFIRED